MEQQRELTKLESALVDRAMKHGHVYERPEYTPEDFVEDARLYVMEIRNDRPLGSRDIIGEFVRAYMETALWSSTGDDDEPLDDDHGPEDIAAETLEQMLQDCEKFCRENQSVMDGSGEWALWGACLKHGPDFGPAGRAGHDFWLTRNGHGAGFWDGDWEKEAGEKLTKASEAFGEVFLHVEGDGKIYQS